MTSRERQPDRDGLAKRIARLESALNNIEILFRPENTVSTNVVGANQSPIENTSSTSAVSEPAVTDSTANPSADQIRAQYSDLLGPKQEV